MFDCYHLEISVDLPTVRVREFDIDKNNISIVWGILVTAESLLGQSV